MTPCSSSKIKLLLVGPYPPPYGGISTTVRELHQFLLTESSCEVQVLNIGKDRCTPRDGCIPTFSQRDFVKKVFQYARKNYLIHLETNGHNTKSWQSALVCALAGALNRRKTIIALGSGLMPDYLYNLRGFNRFLVKLVVKWAGLLICRNDSMAKALESHGAVRDRIVLVPGFVGLTGRKPGPVPQIVERFCQNHQLVLGATVGLSYEYGIPLALQALQVIREEYSNAGLILMGIGPETADALPELASVREHVLLAGALAPDVALAVMKKLSVFLRPTCCDGDSVSVREALALGIPVVASATGYRPESVRLFKVGDCEDLSRQVKFALVERNQIHGGSLSTIDGGSASTILNLYRRLSRDGNTVQAT